MIYLLALLCASEGTILASNAMGRAIYPISSNTGVVTDYIFNLVTGTSVPAGDYLKIQFPSAYTNINLASSTCYIGSTSATCSQVGTSTVSIVLPAVLSSNTRYSVRVPQITNPSAGTTGYFVVYFQYSVSAQIIDINDAFGTLHISSTMKSGTGSVTATSSIVGVTSSYTFKTSLLTALPASSIFQIFLPTGYSFASTTVTAVSYSGSIAAITGPFTGVLKYGFLEISGLSQALVVGTGVAFSISIANPGYVLAAAAENFEIRTLYGNGSVGLDSSVVANGQITAAAITAVTHAVYTTSSKFVVGNLVYTMMNFTTTNPVPQGGTITVDYGAALTTGLCVTIAGIGVNSLGALPTCSVSGNTATITGFGIIAGGTAISVINQVTAATVANAVILTQDGSSRNIDTSSTGGGITLDATNTLLSSTSISYSIVTGRTGTLTLGFTSASTATVVTITTTLPSSFSVSTPTCTVGGVSETCSISGSVITITPTSITCNGGCTVVLDATSHITFSSLGSSSINILEQSVTVAFASTSEFVTLLGTLASSGFSASSLVYITSQSAWSPYTASLTLLNGLNAESSPTITLQFTGYSSTLGTGYGSAGAIGCKLTGITNGASPAVCTLTPAATPTIVVSSFASIKAATQVSIEVMVLNPAASGSVVISTGYTQYNSVATVADTKSFTTTLTAAASNWPTAQGTTPAITVVNNATSISFTLLPTAASNTNDLLLIAFPSGWVVSASTAVLSGTTLTATLLQNTYAPSLIISLGTNVLDSATSSTVTVTVVNGAYQGSGAGNIQIGLIANSGWALSNYGSVTDGTNAKTYVGATRSTFLYAAYDFSNTHMSAGAVVFKNYLTLTNPIPSTGYIYIALSAIFNLANSYCSFAMNLGTSTTCTITGATVAVSGFKALAAGTSTYIKVLNIINPTLSTTSGVITVYSTSTSSTSDIIDFTNINATQILSAQAIPAVTIENYTFFPLSTGSYGQFFLKFYMETSVPYTGTLTITFPSAFSLPTITASNCNFNLEFLTCSSTGNVLSITPVTSFPAGISMSLSVPSIVVPGNLTTPVLITSAYAGMTLSQILLTSTDPHAFFTASSASTVTFTPVLVVSPSNQAEIASYSFSISYPISSNDLLVIWFPSAFPQILGNVACTSSASPRPDGIIKCRPAHSNAIISTGMTGTTFTFVVYGVNNPGLPGASGNLVIQILNSSNQVISYGTTFFTITSLPSSISLQSITLLDYSMQAVTNYTFITAISAIPTSVWFDFPMDFTNELFGNGDTFVCTSVLVDSTTGAQTSWVTGSPTCTNPQKNRIVMTATGSGSASSKFLQTTIVGVKSPSIVGKSHYFRVTSLNQYSIVEKTYDFNTNYVVTYLNNKQSLVIQNLEGVFSMNAGVIQQFSIYTASINLVAKDDIKFTYTISSLNPTTGISISPSLLTLAAGTSSLAFTIRCDNTVTAGNFIIKWGIVSSRYLQPKYSLLVVDPMITYQISVANIPPVYLGTTTVPLTILCQAAPVSSLSIIATGPTGFTITPIAILAGTMGAAYTISIAVTVVPSTYQLSFTLQGDDAGIFYFDNPTPYVLVGTFDTTTPSILSFVISSPRHKTYIDMTLQTSESCLFFYTYGQRGLEQPSNTTLISNSTAGLPGFYVGIIDATYQYSFTATGLVGESDYILYGLLGDMSGNFMGSAFEIDLFTEDMDDSVTFSLSFLAPYPTNAQVSSIVIPALASQFVVSSSRISLLSSSGALFTFQLNSDATTDAPSPANIIQYCASYSEINALLTGLSLDPTFDISASLKAIVNPKPLWDVSPYINSTTKDSVSVNFSMVYAGTVHALIIGDSDPVPSSRQVVLGLNAYNGNATLKYSQAVNASTLVSLNFGGLQPTSSYTLIISAENNLVPDRCMDDDLMASIGFITQAGIVGNTTTNTTTFGKISILVGILLALVII